MKNHYILHLTIIGGLLFGLPVYSQDDLDDEEQVTVVKKTEVTRLPNYEMMTVRGYCEDAVTKTPLAGIMVRALNDSRYTAMTEDNGEFIIKVPTFVTALFIHAPQYLSQQVGLGKTGSVIRVQMLPDKFRSTYDEIPNITASATASIRSTTSQTVETDIENLLGADIRAITHNGGPSYGAAMFIRGLNSLNANAQPLIVIDGIPQDMQQTRTSLHDGDYTNLLLNINPEDIEKVTVLKNATALYGAKGGNGVILIDTKRGHSMATRIDANIGIGVTLVPNTPDMMDANQYRLYATEMLGTYPSINKYTVNEQTFRFLSTNADQYPYRKYLNNTDWKDEVYQQALNQNYNINVQGGDNIGMYNLSLGYTDGQSTARKNGFNRLNVRFNTDINIIKRLTTRFDMSYTKINRDVLDNGAPADLTSGTVSSPTFLALIKSPFLHPYTYNSITQQFSSTLSEADDFLTPLNSDLSLGNPTALLANGSGINKNRVETTHFNTVIAPRYEFNDHLTLTETFSYTLDRVSQRYFRPSGGMPSFLIDGIGRVYNMSVSMFSKETSVVSDTRLQYTNQFKGHFLNAYAGVRYSSFAFDNNVPKGESGSVGNDNTPNINGNMDYIQATGADDEWRNLAWYANADYNYRNRYFAQFTLSMEGCSRFGKEADGLKLGGVRWGIFPSMQLGWVLTNESWFPKTKGINYLLLKAGWDLSGNDDISNYAARTSFSVSKYLWRSTAAQLDNIGNEKITWEQTSRWNIGLKTSLFNNRVGLDFDYYKNHTSNLLTLKHFDNPVAGINNYWSNGGSLENQGFETTITTKPLVARHLTVELGASVGHYVNKVKSLPNSDRLYMAGQQVTGYTSSIYGTDNIATIIGQPIGVFYGYQTSGVFSSDEAARIGLITAENPEGYLYQLDATGAAQYFKAGDVQFVDQDRNGVIDEKDKTIIGDPNPDIYGNIFASVNWKNLSLHIGFNYSLGNDVFNYQRSLLESGSNFYNQTTAMTNRWRAEGQQTSMPRISYGDPMGNARFSDRWIEDGSYLRLKTVNLTYKVPVENEWLQGLTIWAEANNLLTLTHYLGGDPEFAASNSVLYQGIDTGNVALGRTFTLGLKINL